MRSSAEPNKTKPTTIDSQHDQISIQEISSRSLSSSDMVDEGNGGSENSFGLTDEDIYEVQAILEKRIRHGNPEYLIKWKDWNLPEHNTWENMDNLKNVKHMVKKFQQNLKNKKSGSSKPIQKKDKPEAQAAKISPNIQIRNKHVQEKKKSGTQEKGQIKDKFDLSPSKKIERQRQRQKDKQRQRELQRERQRLNIPIQIISQQNEQLYDLQPSTQPPNHILKKKSSQTPKIHRIQSQKSIKSVDNPQKRQQVVLSIGQITNYIIEQKQIEYEVDVVDRQNRVIGVKRVKSAELRKNQTDKLRAYLEECLIDIERYDEMVMKSYDRMRQNNL